MRPLSQCGSWTCLMFQEDSRKRNIDVALLASYGSCLHPSECWCQVWSMMESQCLVEPKKTVYGCCLHIKVLEKNCSHEENNWENICKHHYLCLQSILEESNNCSVVHHHSQWGRNSPFFSTSSLHINIFLCEFLNFLFFFSPLHVNCHF